MMQYQVSDHPRTHIKTLKASKVCSTYYMKHGYCYHLPNMVRMCYSYHIQIKSKRFHKNDISTDKLSCVASETRGKQAGQNHEDTVPQRNRSPRKRNNLEAPELHTKLPSSQGVALVVKLHTQTLQHLWIKPKQAASWEPPSCWNPAFWINV